MQVGQLPPLPRPSPAHSLSLPHSAPGLQGVPKRRVPGVEARREPAGRHHPSGLRAHDLAARAAQLYLQGGRSEMPPASPGGRAPTPFLCPWGNWALLPLDVCAGCTSPIWLSSRAGPLSTPPHEELPEMGLRPQLAQPQGGEWGHCQRELVLHWDMAAGKGQGSSLPAPRVPEDPGGR